MSTNRTPLDDLRYLAAISADLLDYAIDRLGLIDMPPAAEDMQTMLELVQGRIRESLAAHADDAHLPPSAQRYSDGRAVQTVVDRIEDHGIRHTHIWHPDVTHETNQPHREQFTSGGGHHVRVVGGPGVFDVLTLDELSARRLTSSEGPQRT
ncbi:MAG: hypothetical protein PGN27_04235 [Mycolicibacterium neoaurum]|uniref:hypothetical protein n=1 Tax=Mycolicibacterium neoaurum TaxID=1795 RepID=UPI002FFBA075